ncbi:PAS domain S-box protein [Fredinandcohnia sp. 179-A 10B2 NHS]|uniref:sensor histidine kinase n=1 Tax=Fredinandcohnia sp. 179-A 10B2 NHS TaxID=3235176 RepID=UPI0039A24BC4
MNFNQQMFETILTHTSDMLFIVNQYRHIIYATPSFYEITGYSPEELNDVDAFIIVHPEDRELMMHRHKHLLDSEESNSSEYRMVRKNGEIRYFECKTTPLPGTENYLQVVSTRDVTERKMIELELEYHKNRHEVLQKSLKNFSNDLTAVMKLSDLENRMMKELVTILPDSKPKITSTYSDEVGNDMNLPIGKITMISDNIFVKVGERKNRPYIISLDALEVSEPMELIWLETFVHYSVMVFENLNMIENLMHQLEAITLQKETPQWVFRMMFNLQEQQRLTLSSDLHDTVLQDQIDLYRRLETLLKRFEIDKEAKTKLIEIEQGLLDIIHAIRATCNNLRPPLLRELGLVSSLENLFDHIQLSSTYKIQFSSGNLSLISLNEEQTIGIYRIVQEFLHYAEEFSKASVVRFNLYSENEKLKLVYSDNGRMYDANEKDNWSTNLRITSVSQRAKSLGGRMDITSKHVSGFVATLELPNQLERSLV